MNTVGDELRSLGHRPKKSLGQNFLIDKNILQKAIDWANPKAGGDIVEIGPGLGILTEALLKCGANVYAVEYDPTLYQNLRSQLLPKWPNNFHLLHGDAVKLPRAGFTGQNYKVVANLPYAISTPWLEGILRGPLPESMTLLLQRETAQRFMAANGAKMGAISVLLNGAFQTARCHHVPPTCFFPRPKVDSMLVYWEQKSAPFIFSGRTHALIRFLFNHRRKQLRGVIQRAKVDANREVLSQWLRSLGNIALRAEEITPTQWQDLEEFSADLDTGYQARS
ncbi:MAG: 16S rRNA (adenine(1518)-N(6)/adenine(1519)-N(6))-dimethyltransferase RsmA [Puniceicoccales bacterium]|jgi:16S rRNA (adenine1518-N6/adenine1519-N6)-dimethyltransferase|nr:16S rRNA (adenine(1518)-N(6)/adenine(1519)-N(6))-dimethyltransferase RsmA [Puniceicoccales bacterium]